jgi:hypothetical protein
MCELSFNDYFSLLVIKKLGLLACDSDREFFETLVEMRFPPRPAHGFVGGSLMHFLQPVTELKQ